MENFWFKNHIGPGKIFSPVAILREQANFLADSTGHAVVAEVKKMSSPSPDFFYMFDLFASAINYRFRLFTVSYPLGIFPIRIYPDERIIQELSLKNDQVDGSIATSMTEHGNERSLIANNESEYIKFIKEILQCQNTVKIVNAILSHVEMDVAEHA